MPIFGTKDNFAIQFERRAECSYFLRFWCNNKSIGNFYETMNLSMAVYGMRNFIKDEQFRRIKNSHLLSKEILFYLPYDSHYFNGGCIYDIDINKIRVKKGVRERKWKKLLKSGSTCFLGLSYNFFELNNITNYVFETTSMMLFNEPQCNRQRFIWRDLNTFSLYEGFITHKPFVEDLMKEWLVYVGKNNFLLEGLWEEGNNTRA